MDSEPEGYSREDHWIKIPLEDAVKLPTRDRLGNKHVDLLSASQGNGSVDFPQDSDGLTRRAPTAIFFKGPQHVYPTIVMAAVMDILGIPQDGFDYDLDGDFETKCNKETFELEKLSKDDFKDLNQFITKHKDLTGSEVAKSILKSWDKEKEKFVKVMPTDYKRVLIEMKENKKANNG